MAEELQDISDVKFNDRAGFVRWLASVDEEVRLNIGPILAMRAALRVCVFVESDAGQGTEFSRLALAVFRTNAIAWVAATNPTSEFAGAVASTAGYSAIFSRAATPSASAVAAAAKAAVSLAVNPAGWVFDEAANAAERGAEIANYATESFWGGLRDDGEVLLQGLDPKTLSRQPLWLGGTPTWWPAAFEQLKSALARQTRDEAEKAGWTVWTSWLQCRVDGIPSWQLSLDDAAKIEARIVLGDGREDFWERKPEAINAEIMNWLSDSRLYARPVQRKRPTQSRRAAAKERQSPSGNFQEAAVQLEENESGRDVSAETVSDEHYENAPLRDAIQRTLDENISNLKKFGSKFVENIENGGLPVNTKRADLEPLADTVDGSVDHLGRANIAYALAGRINEVWDQMNKPGGKAAGPAPGFVIHIDAPWGGGKSTFAEHLAQILNPYTIKGPLPGWLKALPIGKDGTWPERFRRPWHIVKFNAWQHQHVSPPWWVFYETIRHSCVMQSTSESNQRVPDELPSPLAGFAFDDWYDRIGSRGAFWITERVWRLFSPGFIANAAVAVGTIAFLLALSYFGLIKLDLNTIKADAAAGQTPLISSVIILLLGGGVTIWKFVSAFANNLIPGTADAAKNYSLGSGDPLKRMKAHFVSLMETVHRPVLVIVDDLDRCEPAFVVELVRGMQTILASPRVVYLLLGDRDWIEQSFTEVHKAMKGVEVGPEHRFGGRFVEKAIQFSMVLPDVSEQGRQDYVRQLLTSGSAQAAPAPVTAPPSVLETAIVPESQRSVVEALKADAKDVLETDDYEQREQKARTLADKYDLDLLALPKQEFEQEMAQKLFFRAATDSTAERATSHMIEGMASILPANPRQIKRIINTLSLLGQVLRIKDPAKRPGSADWQLLARWVVLMVEWPKSWFTLSRHPGLADVAQAIAQGKSDAEIAGIEITMDGLGYLPAAGTRPLARLIASNPTVMRALDFTEPDQAHKESDWVHKPITASEIEWLRVVMPAASGQVLQPPQQEKPASADATPTGKAA